VSLNIKDEQTHALVRELARRTGASQTAAVREAVQRRLEELDGDYGDDATVERMRAAVREIVGDFRTALTDEALARIRQSDDWLYDAVGMPR
jgi:antitoxin VapB